MERALWICLAILHFSLVFAVSICLVDYDLGKVNVTTLEMTYRIEMKSRNGKLDYEMYLDVKWNITQDIEFDGILYQVKDGRQGSSHFPFDEQKNGRCDNMTDIIWTVDGNGTSVQCQVPCAEFMPEQCSEYGICPLLRDGYKSLSKDARNFTIKAEFGRTYYVRLVTYRDWRHGGEGLHFGHSETAFCRHELRKHHNNTKTIDDHCSEKQNWDEAGHYSGPIADWHFLRPRINMSQNRGEVLLQFRDPHDIRGNESVVRYRYNAKNCTVNKLNSSDEKFDAGINQVMIKDIKLGVVAKIHITAQISDSACALCKRFGMQTLVEFRFPDIDGCVENRIKEYNITTEPFCDEAASCFDQPSDKTPAAICRCPEHHNGNGINISNAEGSGCQLFGGCSNTSAVKNKCVANAECQALDPPIHGFKCFCPDGFDGDGYANGNGCTENKFTYSDVTIGVIVPTATVFVTMLAIFWYCRRKRQIKLKSLARYRVPPIPFLIQHKGQFGSKWELDRSQIELKGIIGRGNFSVVQRAILKSEDRKTLVAVKMTTEATSEANKELFKHEISLLSEMKSHKNLLGLIGCCTGGDQPMLMVTQYMKYGDLLNFLWKAREETFRMSDPVYNINELSIYAIASQVACGMTHLKEMKIIHGDLAARNILVGEELTCKISDFGLANDVYREGILRNVKERTLPVKWVSPERMMCGDVPIDWRSDVWSFGILLYETVTLGSTPYPGINTSELFDKLKSGYRMPKPSHCSDCLYDIMMRCWQWVPSKRPLFKNLEEELNRSRFSSAGVTYINLHAVVPGLYGAEDASETTFLDRHVNDISSSFVIRNENLMQ